MADRYATRGFEGELEPGSNGHVLANRLGITHPEEMDALESQLLQELYQWILWQDFPDRRLSVTDLKNWHRWWLGNVYRWVGEERSVNLSKGGFPFAASARIGSLLQAFEDQCLYRYTPCYGFGGAVQVSG
jgi:cell filamentation protein